VLFLFYLLFSVDFSYEIMIMLFIDHKEKTFLFSSFGMFEAEIKTVFIQPQAILSSFLVFNNLISKILNQKFLKNSLKNVRFHCLLLG